MQIVSSFIYITNNEIIEEGYYIQVADGIYGIIQPE